MNKECPDPEINKLHTFYTSNPEKFGFIKKILEEQFKKGHHKGAEITIFHENKLLLHAIGGDCGKMPYQSSKSKSQTKCDSQSLFRIFSSGKMFEVLAIAKLMDMKINPHLTQNGLDTKLTDFWPEFGKEGKENITLANVLKHEAGLSFFFPQELPISTVCMLEPEKNATFWNEEENNYYKNPFGNPKLKLHGFGIRNGNVNNNLYMRLPPHRFVPKTKEQIMEDRNKMKKLIEEQKPHWNPYEMISGSFCFFFCHFIC